MSPKRSTDGSKQVPGAPATEAPLWDPNRSYQRIVLRNVALEMNVGIGDWERLKSQRVLVNVELFAPLDSNDRMSIEDCINYDEIHEYLVTEWPSRPHTDLLETLVEELVGVCFRDNRVKACRVSIQKPDVYNDAEAAMVEFYRVR